MIELVVGVIILLVVVYIARLVIGELGLPDSITKIIYILIAIIALFYFLDLLGLYTFQMR